MALAWQELYAGVWTASLTWTHRLLLFVSVWLGYAADRWLDGISVKTRQTDRHDFYRRHRLPLLILWVALFAGALVTALLRLPVEQLHRGTWLVVAVLFYTLFAQTGRRLRCYSLAKATGIGLLVWASACLFAVPWPNAVDMQWLSVTTPIPVFVLNCLMIHRWDERSGSSSTSALLWTSALAVGMAIAAWAYAPPVPAVGLVGASALVALLLLWILHLYRRRLASGQRRSLADVCLLTPLLMLPAT